MSVAFAVHRNPSSAAAVARPLPGGLVRLDGLLLLLRSGRCGALAYA